MIEAISSFFEKAKFDYTILASEYAWVLIVFSVLVVVVVCWIKKRAMKIEENRTFKNRQKVCSALEYSDANPIQQEFDF